MDSPRSNIKLLLLALLWFCGLGLIALSFAQGPPSNPHPFPSSKFAAWGVCCVLVALTWMYWDYKRRRLTSDEKLEQLLLDVARRYRHTRSLDAVIAEYRERGANEGTLDIIRSAPQMLKARADAKIRFGLQLLVTGIITSAGIYWLSRVIGFSHYEVAVGAIGGVVGFIIVGLRQRRAFTKSNA